jgi:hypothetical protein
VAVPILLIPLGLDFALAVAGAITFGVAILILGRWRKAPATVGPEVTSNSPAVGAPRRT